MSLNHGTKITNWLIHGNCVVGDTEDGRGIRTSRIVDRNDNIVTTKSGSTYQLENPHYYMTNLEIMQSIYGEHLQNWKEVIDDRIKNYETKNKQ